MILYDRETGKTYDSTELVWSSVRFRADNTKQIAKNMFRRRTDVDMEILGVVPVEELTGVPTKDVGDRIHKMMEQALEG